MPSRLNLERPPTFYALCRHHGTTTTLLVGGDVDIAAAAALRRAIHEAIERRPETLVLDLEGVTFLSVIALRIVLDAEVRAGWSDVRLVTTGAGPLRRRLNVLRSLRADAIERQPA